MSARRGWIRACGKLVTGALTLACLVAMGACSHAKGGNGVSGGGGGGGGAVANTLSVAVNLGPNGNALNILYASVQVCVKGTTTCQTIPNVLVDTGSTGLRLLSSQVTLNLTHSTDMSGNPLGECVHFVSNDFVWGSVNVADVTLAGEKASSVPVQIISPSGFPLSSSASGCPTGGTELNSVAALGGNGILGVGLFVQDCGNLCATLPAPSGAYYSCVGNVCNPVVVALANQVQNPVSLFTADNNGVLINLPSVSNTGSATVSGSLIFGIGTQTNNGLGTAKIYTTTPAGDYTATYNTVAYPQSFVDSGSNAFFFLDSVTTGLAACAAPNAAFYCPASPANFNVTTTGSNSTMGTVSFSISSIVSLKTANPSFAAFSNVGGPQAGSFDFGLPFFYGRPVFTAITGKSAGGATGPFWAY
jgi:hypothetical protein